LASDKNDDRPTGKNTPASDSDEYMDPVLTVTESYGGGNTQPDPMVVEIVIDLLMMVAQLLLLFHHQMLTSIIDSPLFLKLQCLFVASQQRQGCVIIRVPYVLRYDDWLPVRLACILTSLTKVIRSHKDDVAVDTVQSLVW